jgi:guanyl-specific ribonuclease Sa
MPGPVTNTKFDLSIEEHAMRRQGVIGRGTAMGNALFSIDYDCLPHEARRTIKLIIDGGPFPYPGKDGTPFGNHLGDLPEGQYLEYTVPTPGCATRGTRRIVVRKKTGQLFLTVCHYERVQAKGGTSPQRKQAQVQATAALAEEWRNGFYVITGMPLQLRQAVVNAIKARNP